MCPPDSLPENAASHQPAQITKPKLIYAEGEDAKRFLEQACVSWGISNVGALSFGGISELSGKLAALREVTGADILQSLVIVRDAEGDADGAFRSATRALRQAHFSVPREPFEVTEQEYLRTGILIFPGLDDKKHLIKSGTLEDLCLQVLADRRGWACVEPFLECAKKEGCDIRRQHKAKLHAYFSAHNKFVGMKLGEGSKAGAWDWGHCRLQPFRKVLSEV